MTLESVHTRGHHFVGSLIVTCLQGAIVLHECSFLSRNLLEHGAFSIASLRNVKCVFFKCVKKHKLRVKVQIRFCFWPMHNPFVFLNNFTKITAAIQAVQIKIGYVKPSEGST